MNIPMRLFFTLLFLSSNLLHAQNGAPVIQNFTASVNWPAQTLTLQYDVADPENDPLEIQVELSNDGGKTFAISNQIAVSGDVGFPVSPGTGRLISCDLNGLSGSGNFQVRLIALDRQPFDLQELVDAVDSTRLRADLEFVEGIRHATTGLTHLRAVRDSIENLFHELQMQTELQAFMNGNFAASNVVGSVPGISHADTVIIVDAHYDSVSNAPGADDNGSGTVGVWEVARLLSGYPAKKTLRYIGFDQEEAGLLGSIQYVSNGIPAHETIAGVLNFEMIGYYSEEPNSQTLPTGFNIFFPDVTAALAADQYRGNFITNVGQQALPQVADLFAASAATYVPDLKVHTVLEPAGFTLVDLRRSDHAPFWASQIPAIMITDGANFRNECYHTPGDTLNEKLNFTFMANVVKATLAAAAQLAEVQHGHWATANFAGTVGTTNLQRDCAVSAGAYPNGGRTPGLFFGECPIANLNIRVFNANGGLVHTEILDAPPRQEWYPLNTPALPAGIYFLNLQAAEGNHTLKVALF
ncbi:MAG: M28 family peptidase [Lewinellaceae bacterium]|nr:M28 family peptidase [Lewinellaceae bacterium]